MSYPSERLVTMNSIQEYRCVRCGRARDREQLASRKTGKLACSPKFRDDYQECLDIQWGKGVADGQKLGEKFNNLMDASSLRGPHAQALGEVIPDAVQEQLQSAAEDQEKHTGN